MSIRDLLQRRRILRFNNASAPSAVMLLLTALASAHGADWPQWRGPKGDGISLEKNVPVRWSDSENVVWKTPLSGSGHSSPVVWKDSVFLTTALSNS